MKLKDKVAVITGGNSGIGLATARLMITEGAKVAIIGRNQDSLDKTSQELGVNSLVFKGDVSSLKDIEAFIESVKRKFGKIDVLFVNAGVAYLKPVHEITEDVYDDLMDINIKGAFFAVQKALPYMGKGSSIVMTSSTVAHKGYVGSSIYSASKAAVKSFVQSFAAELAPQGIRVNAISPGPIATDFVPRHSSDPEGMRTMLSQITEAIPMKRLGQTEEVAKAVVFLASQDSSFTTGAEILVDGGMINA